MKEFYEEINNQYISLKKEENLIKKYHNIIKEKKIKKIIEENNNKYIKEKREKCDLLNNINGFPLDEYQSRVVLSQEKNILVVAGAGSGKSLTIIGKIVYLVKEEHINPKNILCISFTNDATINLKNNISKNYNFDIDIYTFHKLSLKILKDNNEEYNIAPEELLDKIIDDFFNNITPSNKIINKSINKLTNNKDIKEINKLKKLIKTFINLYKSNNYNLEYFQILLKKIKHNIFKYRRNKKLLLLIINIYIQYQEELNNENSIDFNDMINKCYLSLSKNGLKKKWKYIIIDEYQDTSLTKFNLINKIIELTNADFLAVGDDFQSIYRFTGCNLQIFLNFQKYLPYSKIYQIVNTYRNPQELIDIAGSFIMKNKNQQKKKLKSKKHLNIPIKVCFYKNRINALKKVLEENINKEILIIGRNNNDINKYIDNEYKVIDKDKYKYKNIEFKYLTIHRSKGLESEIVIIINLYDSYTSLPCKIKDEHILKYINNTKDYYPYEEERRLFYVALTRTKTYTYLLSPTKNYSMFIKELLNYDNVEQTKR